MKLMPAIRVKPVLAQKDALFSQEDDSLLEETPFGDGHKISGELPVILLS